ncbi:MAG: alpha/beta hydrolase [Betaproteobacteria bacterium]|nr:alpha/beta hydrolase [Betaproteobacteria bacterium]
MPVPSHFKRPAIRGWRVLISFVLLLGLSGCSAIGVFNSLIPEGEMVATRDIVYGTNPRQKLDVYQPKAPSAKPRTVVVFYYGGAWDSGDKSYYLFAAEALASRGYVVVVPDYRIYPEVIFPAYMDDAANSLKWTLDNIGRYGGDANNVFTMGHSAGGQLAALVAFDGSYATKAGIARNRVRGVVSLAGALDFLPLTEENLFKIFPEPVRAASQPINFARGDGPPVLVLHGEADTRVGIHNSRNFAARVRERGGHAEETYYPGMSHAGIILAISAPLREGKTVLERISGFIDAQAR